MKFGEFAAFASDIEAKSADTAITGLVTELFRDADGDLPVLARFVQGRVFPAWNSTTLDVGPNYCYEAIARAAGRNVSADDVEDRLADLGDVGAVAASYDFGGQRGLSAFGGRGASEADRERERRGDRAASSEAQAGDSPTVAAVYDDLTALAAAEGPGSQDKKIDILFGLFNRCDADEARYVARLVLSEMRIGVGEGTVRDAIAAAFDVPVEAVERALQVSNDYGLVAETARDEGVAGLDDLELEIGRPVQAMLAQAGTVGDAMEEYEEVATQWKFDGARVQLHYDGEDVSIFSRNMEDVTDALPEIVECVEENLDAPAIVDGEVVAIDDGEPLPFQEVLRRFRRKHDVEKAREEVGLELRAFDCLHAGVPERESEGRETPHGGGDLLDAPLTERHDRLTAVLDEGVSPLHVTRDADRIEDVEANALEAGHEGIMLKNPGSSYSPGRRGRNWLKRKPDVETLDLVVTGAEWGEGRRASLLGTFLLSARTPDGYETLGKVATGLTDEELAEVTELLEPHVRSQEGKDVEIAPEIVFEVGYEEIQTSPTYSSGYALRFPRFLGVRTDKAPEDADALERVERLAEEQ